MFWQESSLFAIWQYWLNKRRAINVDMADIVVIPYIVFLMLGFSMGGRIYRYVYTHEKEEVVTNTSL